MPPSGPPDTASPRTPSEAAGAPATVHSLQDALTRRLIRADRRARLTEGLGTPATSTPAEAAAAMCDALIIHDISAWEPAQERHRYLQVTNLANVLSDIMISPHGELHWNYRPYAGTPADPATTTAIILTVLDPGRAPARPLPAPPRTTLAGHLLTAAAARGIRADILTPNLITADAPARPARGSVLAAGDGGIWWTCPLAGLHPGPDGLDPDQIAATIASALTIPGITRTNPDAASTPAPATAHS